MTGSGYFFWSLLWRRLEREDLIVCVCVCVTATGNVSNDDDCIIVLVTALRQNSPLPSSAFLFVPLVSSPVVFKRGRSCDGHWRRLEREREVVVVVVVVH